MSINLKSLNEALKNNPLPPYPKTGDKFELRVFPMLYYLASDRPISEKEFNPKATVSYDTVLFEAMHYCRHGDHWCEWEIISITIQGN